MQGTQFDSVLLVEIAQADYSLKYRIITHTSPSGPLQGYSVAFSSGGVFIAAVTNETAWTGDTSWTKLLFLRV